MKAQLIYTPGNGDPIIPSTFRLPKENQFLGTELEKLTEVACRICYDSMGAKVSRSSKDLHDHIQDAPNLSVYEHAWTTIAFEGFPFRVAMTMLNRRGTHCEYLNDKRFEITANLRAVLEWEKFKHSTSDRFPEGARLIGASLLRSFKEKMPTALRRYEVRDYMPYIEVEDLKDTQRPWSVWLYGSRGFTHEMVRHRFNMSQRSTRFVDEYLEKYAIQHEIACIGEYVYHPLILKYLADESVPEEHKDSMIIRLLEAQKADHQAYKLVTDQLEAYCGNRKQARGAARGSLANALASEMIYTASVADWKGIFAQRATDLADAEIREVIIDAIQSSGTNLYGFRPAADGLGEVAYPL